MESYHLPYFFDDVHLLFLYDNYDSLLSLDYNMDLVGWGLAFYLTCSIYLRNFEI